MRTAVVSDLHLGTRSRHDALRDPGVREALLGALSRPDQLVLLGDTIELRDRPLGEALTAAEPVLEHLGAALHGGRVVLVPGNHDHRLVDEARALHGRPWRASLCATVPRGARGALGRVRSMLGTELVVAYPGVWLADGVWATHGHYLDAHSAAPSLECTIAAAVAFARRRPPASASAPADYEAVLAPAYRLYYEIAQRRRLQFLAGTGKAIVRRVETGLGVRGGASGRRSLALGSGRLGTAAGEVRRPGVLPLAAVLDRLGIGAEHVLFGHTHRTGPLPEDSPADWRLPTGTHLWNTGSWVYEPALCDRAGAEGPYWPGTVTLVEGGRPRFVRALGGWGRGRPRAG